jgi:Uma2 family endonuclease
VVEVISPSTAQLEKNTKRRVYAQAGVKEMWLVDPVLCQIHVYDFERNAAKPVKIVDEDETLETRLLEELSIRAADIFRR